MNPDLIVVVVRAEIGEIPCWRIVGVPRGVVDVTLYDGRADALPPDWVDYGAFPNPFRADEVARELDYMKAATASFEAGQKKP